MAPAKKAAPKPPTPEEIDRHIAALNAEAESLGPVVNPDGTPTDATVEILTGKKPAPKSRATGKPLAKAAPAPKTAATQTTDSCRWGHGRYYSPPNEPDCKLPKAPGKQLCGAEGKNHERAMAIARKAAKEAGTAKVGAPKTATPAPAPKRPAKPKGTSAEGLEAALAASVAAAKKPARNSGGAPRTVKPPTPEMHSGPIARGIDSIPVPIVALAAAE